MPTLLLVLFDDAAAQSWAPFALTRPAGELLFGALTQRARAERIAGARCAVHLSADHLAGFEEEGAPPTAPLSAAPTEGDRLFWLSRALPAWSAREALQRRPDRAGPLLVGGEVAGWYAPAGTPPPTPDLLLHPQRDAGEPAIRLEGRVLRHVWELVSCNREQIIEDVAALRPTPSTPSLPAGVHHWGEHPLIVDQGVQIEPGSVFDTTDGPIWLERGSIVRAFTRLAGPAYVGPQSWLLGGSISCVSLGPVCRVHGELSSSVLLGYSNKQHAGHMGHGYLGRWVNLGAGTNNSDLKNNYGSIRIWTPEGDVDTGEMKMGCLLGDHVKTGIGLQLNTGTVVGAGSNLYGSEMPPKYVPPFSWGQGEELVEYRFDKFVETAERAMSRRDVALSQASRSQLEAAWARGRADRGT